MTTLSTRLRTLLAAALLTAIASVGMTGCGDCTSVSPDTSNQTVQPKRPGTTQTTMTRGKRLMELND